MRICEQFLADVNSRSRSLYAIPDPSVCRLSVTLVRPTQPVEIFGNFFHHTMPLPRVSSFLMPKFVGGGRPLSPKIFVQSDPPLSNSTISTNIGS